VAAPRDTASARDAGGPPLARPVYGHGARVERGGLQPSSFTPTTRGVPNAHSLRLRQWDTIPAANEETIALVGLINPPAALSAVPTQQAHMCRQFAAAYMVGLAVSGARLRVQRL